MCFAERFAVAASASAFYTVLWNNGTKPTDKRNSSVKISLDRVDSFLITNSRRAEFRSVE